MPKPCQSGDNNMLKPVSQILIRKTQHNVGRGNPSILKRLPFQNGKVHYFGSIWSKCFINENRFKFADENDNWYKWTVFLRDNNTGKTNLLKAIAVWNLIMIPPLLRRQVVSIRFCGQKQQYSKSFSFRKTRVPYPMSILGHYNPYSSIFR